MNGDLKNLGEFTDPVEIINALLELLSDKEKDVIVRRYGLRGKEIDTLAAIGEDYDVTRERIRQVQCYACKKLQRNAEKTNLSYLHDWMLENFKESGDILSEKNLEKKLVMKYPQHEDKAAELKLACVLHPDLVCEHNKVNFLPHFRLSHVDINQIKNICEKAGKILRKEGDVMSPNKIVSILQEQLKDANINVRRKSILSAMKLDRRLTINGKGVSLSSWRHVNPKTLFDKILYVLDNENEPIHFTEIAQKIEEQNFDDKSVSTQAVHNELINNPLFILIGRGIYALKTWGYKEGTVSEVLESILEKKGPMHLKDLTQEVLQRRKVKPITVQINLNSKKHKFRKNQYGLYELNS